MTIKDILEMLIEILNRQGAQFMENAPDFNTDIRMRIRTVLSGN